MGADFSQMLARQSEARGAANTGEVFQKVESSIREVQRNRDQIHQSSRLIESTTQKLKARRPPVQPTSEIAEEQQRIQRIVQKNALFIQIVLFLVVLCGVAYLLLPLETANYAALAILGVAVIYRIFFVK